MYRGGIAALLAATVLVSGCTISALGGGASEDESPSPSPSPPGLTTEQGGRSVEGPDGVVLVFETTRPQQEKALRSVRDLQEARVWKRLIRGIESIEFETHPGARSEAGVHLADATLNHTLVEGDARVVCDIRFYPRAIRQELRLWARIRSLGISPNQWRDYNDNATFDEPVPKVSDFWAAILAHELAHCQVGPHGERAARNWEYKTMRRLQRDR